jgi:tetratricopeptide (TPR) repeat protein
MDILYTVEEKYLQALEELNFGELPKALHILNEIITTEPDYARAYYQLGSLYHYQFKDFQTAGYYYKKCIELDAKFPDVYEHYLKLLVTLKMNKLISVIAEQALVIPGVYKALIYESLGIYAEEQLDFAAAKEQYRLAGLNASSPMEQTMIEGHLTRIDGKQNAKRQMIYTFQSE